MAVHYFDNCYVGKQPVAWKKIYWFEEFQESMDRYTGQHDVTEILLITAFNSIQSIHFWKESIVIKQDDVGNTPFLLFQQYFQKPYLPSV